MGYQGLIAFDFDYNTNELEKKLVEMELNGTYHKAYYDVNNYFEKNGVEHTQGSGYISEEPMSYAKATRLVAKLHKEFPYMTDTFNSFTITSVSGDIYDLTELVKENHSLELIEPENLHRLEDDYKIKLGDSENKKSLRFDYSKELIETKFGEYGIKGDYTKAYDITRKFFTDLGYEHKQGSVYKTNEEISDAHIIKDVLNFSKQYPYLAESFKSIQVSDIYATYDITELANHGKEKSMKLNKENITQIEFKINKETNSFEL